MSFRPKTVEAHRAPLQTAWATRNAGTATRPSLRPFWIATLRLWRH